MNFSKPKRYENARYLAFVRTNPCTICGCAADHAHHLKTRGAGGSDLTAIPLCVAHHTEIHQIGKETMWVKYGVNWSAVRIDLLERFIEGES